ncbi:hypothetical protein [Enterococcus florum]
MVKVLLLRAAGVFDADIIADYPITNTSLNSNPVFE